MSKRLVLLTSGWGNVDLGWTYFSKKFRDSGFDVMWASYPWRGFVGIEESAKEVSKSLRVIKDEYEHVTFVRHSMGGLIGRYIIQNLDGDQFVDAYVSIATPHQGSAMAFLANWSKSAQQMKIDSSFLKDLNEGYWPEEMPTLTLSGGWDSLVFPQFRATFDGAKAHTHIGKTTHTGLLLHPRSFK